MKKGIGPPLLLLLLTPRLAFAGRYDFEPGDGLEYLFWIPIGLAIFFYQRYEKSENGGLAAIAGGGLGLLFIYFFPLIATIIVLVLMVLAVTSILID